MNCPGVKYPKCENEVAIEELNEIHTYNWRAYAEFLPRNIHTGSKAKTYWKNAASINCLFYIRFLIQIPVLLLSPYHSGAS